MKEYFKTGLDNYMGSKASPGTIRTLMNEIPPHQERVSGFLGNCAIMRFLKPAPGKMIGFETDPAVATAWKQGRGVATSNLQIVRASFLEIMERSDFDRKGVLIFLDPPYVWSTRSSKRYLYDMHDEAHQRLLIWCRAIQQADVMLCGYPNDLYTEYLPTWRTIEFQAVTRAGTMKTEKVWMNYDRPLLLHDSRFVGADYREREKLKRRRETIYRKIERMEEDERLALFDRLRERFPDLFTH